VVFQIFVTSFLYNCTGIIKLVYLCYFGSTSLVSDYITLFIGYHKIKFDNSDAGRYERIASNCRG